MSCFSKCLVLSCWVFIASCGTGYENSEGLTVFRYNEPGNVTSLDPAFARNQANIWAASQLYNGLVELDADLTIRPSLACDWQISDDGLSYTFFLRKGVKFHDDECFPGVTGREVVAEDFVYSLNRLIDPVLNSPGLWVMNQVARLENGRLDIMAANDTTLTIRLRNAFPPFLGLLTMTYCSAIPHEAIKKYGVAFRRNPVGTGPFRFAYWKEGVKLVFRKHEDYFEAEGNERLPYLDAVSISFIIDRHTAFLEFIQGNLEMISGVDASYKDELLTPDGQLQRKYLDNFILMRMPFLNTEYLGMLVHEERVPESWPLLDRRVRQAINMGFDREKMLLHLRNNIGTPAFGGMVPPGMPGFSDNRGGYHYNADKARQLLTEAGFPNGEGLPRISLMTNQAYQDIAQYIQHELLRIGVQISIDVMPPATLREAMAKGEASFFRASWIADYPDAENYLALFYSFNKSPAGPNYTHFDNPHFDELYEESLSEICNETRFELYREMDEIIIDEAPVVFLYYDQSLRIVPKYVAGMSNNPLNHLDLRRVQVKKNQQLIFMPS